MRSRWIHAIPIALSFFAFSSGWIGANELIAPAPVDEVSIRTLPAFTVIEADETESLGAAWTRGFRLGARYSALAHSGLNTPTIMIFPDWEKNPTAEGASVHVLVQCLLDPLPDFPRVRDNGATVRQMPSVTVACYAQRGTYSPLSFELGLKKIRDYLKAKSIPGVGAPRYLYYSNSTWMPSWWRVSEAQVPIPSGMGQN